MVVSGTFELFVRLPLEPAAEKTADAHPASPASPHAARRAMQPEFAEVPVGRLGPGDSFGDLTLLVNAARDVGVRAVSPDCKVLEFTREALAPVLAMHPELEKRAAQMVRLTASPPPPPFLLIGHAASFTPY